ncbi:Toll-Interleukin-Resistance domain family protein [Hibiscus syriacus]|uniref:Toll-Interleukin-Resistance domain family protein n=1 Tax=Hibiscus syriacus TaxID=106335 RepID=A0A6A3BV34_HIBSY|nr:Toll-Interleukin-Resistance domain family protein [Hibiscus syriacus]
MPCSFCGISPMLFGRKLPVKLPLGQNPPQPQETKAPKNQKELTKGAKKENSSSQSTCNFILIMELRKKITAFRELFDLPLPNTSVSMDQLLVGTMKDLHKFYPESIPNFRFSELKRLPLDKVLVYFCKALQGLGDTSEMSDEWIYKYKHDIYEYDNEKCKKVDKLVEIAVETLNGLIKIAREKFDMTDEDDENKEFGLKVKTFGKVLKESYSDNGSSCPSPVTPTSVLPEVKNGSPKSSSSALLPLRVQAAEKLNPVDVKQLPLDMLPKVRVHVPSSLNQKKATNEKQKKEVKGNSPVRKASLVDETGDFSFRNNADSDKTKLSLNAALPISPPAMQPSKLKDKELVAEKSPQLRPRPPSASPLPSPPTSPLPSASPLPSLASSAEVSLPTPPSERAKMSTDMDTDIKLRPPPAEPSAEVLPPIQPSKLPKDIGVDIRSLTPPAPPFLQPNVVSGGPPAPPAPPLLLPNVVSGKPLAPPLLQPNVVSGGPPFPPPLTSKPTVEAAQATPVAAAGIPLPLPLSPPPLASSKPIVVATGAPLPPPPPILLRSKVEPNGAPLPVPPPPPPPGTTSTMPQPPPPAAAKALSPKKANTKFKRQCPMSNLYRVLRDKVEGCPMQSKSSSEKNIGFGSIPSGKHEISDALAEMTKRSACFQQIEEDVEKYAKSITELKTAISTFSTNDMTKLLKFHKHVELILENLTDETQVLARFEGFPIKKLEALRAASALYSKLESMITVLQNWNFEVPLAELLDKVDHYFNKIKGEIEALEQTKDEESKKFMSHNIEFDFQILVQIKEALVDVSSNCMELAMKERREVKLTENEGSKSKAEAQKKGCVKMQWRAFQLAFQVYRFAGGHDDRADMLSRELAEKIRTDPQ